MSTLDEKNYTSDVLCFEVDREYSRKAVTVVAVAALAVGAVLAKKTKSTAVAAAVAGNTGTGTFGDITLGALAKPGVYKLKCKSAASNAGTFSVLTPDGTSLPDLTVAVAYVSDHINGTLSDATDFIVGDAFTITVDGDGKYYPAVSGAVDGTGEPCAVLLKEQAITTGALNTALVRDGLVISNALVWGSSYDSAPKIAAGLASLETRGIVAVASI